jgi:hypothetical protein
MYSTARACSELEREPRPEKRAPCLYLGKLPALSAGAYYISKISIVKPLPGNLSGPLYIPAANILGRVHNKLLYIMEARDVVQSSGCGKARAGPSRGRGKVDIESHF